MPDSNSQSFRRTGHGVALLGVLALGALGLSMVLNPSAAYTALRGAPTDEALSDAATFAPAAAPVDPLALEHTGLFVGGVFVCGLALAGLAYVLRLLREGASLARVRGSVERLHELGAMIPHTNDTSALEALLGELALAQAEAETQWLSGRLVSQHMGLVNQAYDTRSRSVAEKIAQLHLQALIEGGPSPAHYHPEPARPSFGATTPTPPAPAHAPRAVAAPRPVAPATEVDEPAIFRAPLPPAVQTPVRVATATPQPTGDVGQPRVRHKKKDRHRPGGGDRHAPSLTQQHQAPTQARESQPESAQATAPPTQPAPRPALPAAAPRKLEDWEIEQKYQRSDDTADYFVDSGIVSPPRPRRVQVPGDPAAPASATLDPAEAEREEERRRSQLDLF